MDERLANGFKNQFFRFFYDEDINLSQIFNKLARKHQCFTHRNKWQKFIDEFDPSIKKNTAFTHRGGSKRKPYFAFAFYSKSDEYQYDSWNEKCLFFDLNILTFNPEKLKKYPFEFSIGEHTVKRIYQRTFDLDAHQVQKDFIHPILDELIFLPTVSSLWTNIHMTMDDHGNHFNIEPVVPTPNGLLLGHINHNKKHFFEVRTYINVNQLTSQQKIVRETLLKAFTPYLNSTLRLHPLAEIMELENSFGILEQIVSDIKPNLPAIIDQIKGENDRTVLLKYFEKAADILSQEDTEETPNK